jgi:transposase
VNKLSAERELAVLVAYAKTNSARKAASAAGVGRGAARRVVQEWNESSAKAALDGLAAILALAKADQLEKHRRRGTPVTVTFNGVETNLHRVAKDTGVSYKTLHRRVFVLGMRPEDAASVDNIRSPVGRRYGSLIVVSRGNKVDTLMCRCDCGAETQVQRSHLICGNTTSCGCEHAKKLVPGAPEFVTLEGVRMSLGQLAELARRRPVSVAARLARGMSVQEAAFGK